MADDEGVARTVRVKRLAADTRVSGKFGDYIDDGLPGRRKRARIFGTVIEAIDAKRYKVLFDNGKTENCYSNSLKIETLSSLPPDLPRVLPHDHAEGQATVPAAVTTTESGNDDASEEDIPTFRPEDDEVSLLHGLEEDREEDAVQQEGVPPAQLPVGQLPTATQIEQPATLSYHRRKEEAQQKLIRLIGTTVREKSKNQSILWTVIPNHEPTNHVPRHDDNEVPGLKDVKTFLEANPRNRIFASLFLEMMFKDKDHVKDMVSKMNISIREARDSKVKFFSAEEFLIGLGLIIGAAEFDHQGKKCWITGDHYCNEDGDEEKEFEYHSLVPHPNFDRYMTYSRFKDFRRFLPTIWHDDQLKEAGDPWWQFAQAIDSFNEIRQKKLVKSPWVTIDESMSAWRPRTTALGGLPNISHIPRKPEPLGSEFKCTACPVSGCMTALEIQRGKEGMKNREHNRQYGNTTGCTLRLLNINATDSSCRAVKGDAWFGSVRCCAALKQNGYDSVLQIKQNQALYPKDFITDALKDAPGGLFICLSGTSPCGLPLIALGYRYSSKTILFFVMSADAGTTKLGLPYKMKYTDGFGNLCERNVDRPDVVSKFYEDSNVIDSHNHVRQFELALEKKWLTKDPFFRLTTTIIGMSVADAWRLASVHKMIDFSKKNIEEEKKLSIKKFAGILAFQLISTASSLLSDEPMPIVSIVVKGDLASDVVSKISSTDSSTIGVIRTLKDANQKYHRLVKLPKKKTGDTRHKGSMSRKCKVCMDRGIRHDVVYYCLDCGENQNFCSPDNYNKDRDCFSAHVRSIKRCLPTRNSRNVVEI